MQVQAGICLALALGLPNLWLMHLFFPFTFQSVPGIPGNPCGQQHEFFFPASGN
jgi:hypothetical protein